MNNECGVKRFEQLERAAGERCAPLLADYLLIHRVPTVAHREVVEFVRQRRLQARGIGWIDAHLLASAIVGRVSLWTADARLSAVASQLGLNYE